MTTSRGSSPFQQQETRWRRDESLTLERRQLDLEARTLCLDVGTTKNDDGREVDVTDELRGMLAAQVTRAQTLERQLGRVIPYLFPHLQGTKALRQGVQRRVPVLGEPMRDFRRAWATAGRGCRACSSMTCGGRRAPDGQRGHV